MFLHDRREDHPRPNASTIAIVGAGFSGSLLAVHLARQAAGRLEIALIDRAGSSGRGLAYSAENPNHLLNVRIENMSAFPEQPGHFQEWLERRTGLVQDSLAFVSRRLYGNYVEDILARALRRTDGRVAIRQIEADCVGLRKGHRWILALADGREIPAEAVALSLGHFPPRLPATIERALSSTERVVSDPWKAGGLADIKAGERILIVGSGLTAADVLAQLDDQGCRGPVTVVSRHGLMPNAHARTGFWPPFIDLERPLVSAASLFRLVRNEAAKARAQGVDWRDVVDSLRPFLIPVWRSLPLEEQRRALRHLRAYWDVHRHRVAPEIGARLGVMRAEGRLSIVAGSLVAARASRERVEIDVRRRGGGIETLATDWLVNCSGPAAFGRIHDPLVRAILAQGLGKPDPVGLGLAVTAQCNVVDALDRPHARLFATGPLTRGAFWEMLAVPELRRQAPAVAARMLAAVDADAVLADASG